MEQLSIFDGLEAEGQDTPGMRVFTISEITARIKAWLEQLPILQDLWLEGEISNWRPSPSGHIYFTLKDEDASLRCVMWRSTVQRQVYLPSGDGEAVLAHGHVSVYEPHGQYQFYADDLQPVGVGSLYAQFEQLKARLAQEGLFELARRPLPEYPRRIGVVTSPAGAALRDILNVLRRRFPMAEVILSPTQVQGVDAPAQIVRALNAVGQVEDVDVIILARGGGSLEDLWAFNDEMVARAIAASPVPVVSGVGHETDFTIADFAADVRAPTPSAAAELVAPDRAQLVREVGQLQLRLVAAARGYIQHRHERLAAEERALKRLSPLVWVNRQRQQVDDLAHWLQRAAVHRLELRKEQLAGVLMRLEVLNPAATLARGYAVVRLAENDRVVTSVGQVESGDRLWIQVSDGTFAGRVSDDKNETNG